MKYLTQCFIYLIALILASVLTYSVVALAIAPINVESPAKAEFSPIKGNIEVVINKLIQCESGGNPDAVNYDDGAPGLHSRGILQYQRLTFKGFWEQLINSDIEDAEIDNLWTDAEAQIQLAGEMILDNPLNLNHWKNCERKMNLISLLQR